jgi:hypothetical protein
LIRFYFNLAPNPAKVSLMLEELGLRIDDAAPLRVHTLSSAANRRAMAWTICLE